jgi:hypothetical protein
VAFIEIKLSPNAPFISFVISDMSIAVPAASRNTTGVAFWNHKIGLIVALCNPNGISNLFRNAYIAAPIAASPAIQVPASIKPIFNHGHTIANDNANGIIANNVTIGTNLFPEKNDNACGNFISLYLLYNPAVVRPTTIPPNAPGLTLCSKRFSKIPVS